ncbi:hypothetical protein KC726_01370 [Candidatus Woesebacteria bacterium]|nr:hypothetical protein [Candidatus Woesebacteria bacterium]
MIASILFGGADASFDVGVKIGTNVAVIGSLALSFAVLQKRNLLGDFKYILLGLLAGVLAFLGGGLFGLIPVAYMTTK